jgi:Tol biopolymer transport system component/DNA-binding winged helix-turn-helix (wHTH) protein
MSSTLPVPELLSFGVYSIDRRTQELQKHGRTLKISPQAFTILLCLLDRAGELVSREDLRRRLWPDDTYVDFEGNLNALIRDLRQILGDSARNPRFIKTELRRGYRFIAPVHGAETNAVTAPPTAVAPEDAMPSRLRLRYVALGLCGLCVIGTLAWMLWRPIADSRPVPSGAARISQLTSFVGRAGHPSLSPDGTKVAFHWDGAEESGFDIYVRGIGSEQFQRLTKDPADDLYPAWSPDGRDIAFLRRFQDGHCAIYLIPSGGGAERMVATVPTESILSWSPDGRWISYAVLRSVGPKSSGQDVGIYAVSLLSGQVKRLTGASPNWMQDEQPAFSPDGRGLAFFRTFSSGANELFVQGIDGEMEAQGPPQQITFKKENSRAPAWMPDGQAIVFSSLSGGVRSLWRVPVSPHPGEPQALGGEDASEPAVDRTGRRIVYERMTVTDTLRTLALCPLASLCSGLQPKPLLYSRQLARNPSWSLDGKKIAFESYIGGRVQVWMCNSDGSDATQLSFFPAAVSGTPRWSPDGRRLVADSRVDGRSKVFLIEAATREVWQLTSGPSEDMMPNFSRDGKAVYFASNRSGTFEVWKVALSGGAPTQITKQGGYYAMESLDGTTLYYSKGFQRTQIGRVSVEGGQEQTIIDSLDYWPNFGVAPGGIYYVPAVRQHGVPIYYYDFGRKTHVRVTLMSGVNAQGLAVSSDGRSLLLSIREGAQTNLMSLDLAKGQ